VYSFPHSSHWCTRCPLVALLTRPVRVYLIEPPSGGVEDRIVVSFCREEPSIWGPAAVDNVSVPGATGSRVDSADCSESLLLLRGDGRRRLVPFGAPSVSRMVEDPSSEGGASGCMLGGRYVYVSEVDRCQMHPTSLRLELRPTVRRASPASSHGRTRALSRWAGMCRERAVLGAREGTKPGGPHPTEWPISIQQVDSFRNQHPK